MIDPQLGRYCVPCVLLQFDDGKLERWTLDVEGLPWVEARTGASVVTKECYDVDTTTSCAVRRRRPAGMCSL